MFELTDWRIVRTTILFSDEIYSEVNALKSKGLRDCQEYLIFYLSDTHGLENDAVGGIYLCQPNDSITRSDLIKILRPIYSYGKTIISSRLSIT